MTKPSHSGDTREHLLATGEEIILGKGYAAVGLAEILTQAGVPKGSFYHYFRSKEGFGVEMLERYFADYDLHLLAILQHGEGSARTRLLRYFQTWHQRYAEGNCHQGCLAVKLSGEVSDLSEPMREALACGMGRIITRLADAIRNAQQDGSLATSLEPDHCAQALYALWLGSSLLTKVLHQQQPLDVALSQIEVMLPTQS
jgi:TetR/AcrR family transcriptional repressor of nem operon